MNNINIDQEVKEIMNRIDNYENKKKKTKFIKPLVAVAAIAILFLLPLFSNHDNSYGITRINANEYRLNIFGDHVYFNLYAFVENPDQIQVTEDIYTYENNIKYFDVTEQLEVNTLEVEDYLFLTVSKKGEDEILKYYFINNLVENSRGIVPLDREFNDFEQEMSQVLQLEKQYPMEAYVDESGLCTQYNLNEKASELTPEEREDYQWLQSLKNQVFCSTGGVNSVLYVLQFDGTVDEIGEMIPEKSMVHSGGGPGAPTFEPVEFKNKKIITLGRTPAYDGEDISIGISRYFFKGEVESEAILTLDFDFHQLNPEDYEIEITFDEKPVNLLYEEQNESKVYMISDSLTNVSTYQMEENFKGELQLYEVFGKEIWIKIKDKKTGEIIQEKLNGDTYMIPVTE